ncbi:hypothetical protein GGS26DRAFT_137615 [Hypomontagnella submonticulosa]|nr:hypothetical protein GGS26DRAFT_137615 [Hypomontagnella submonticulosa]
MNGMSGGTRMYPGRSASQLRLHQTNLPPHNLHVHVHRCVNVPGPGPSHTYIEHIGYCYLLSISTFYLPSCLAAGLFTIQVYSHIIKSCYLATSDNKYIVNPLSWLVRGHELFFYHLRRHVAHLHHVCTLVQANLQVVPDTPINWRNNRRITRSTFPITQHKNTCFPRRGDKYGGVALHYAARIPIAVLLIPPFLSWGNDPPWSYRATKLKLDHRPIVGSRALNWRL